MKYYAVKPPSTLGMTLAVMQAAQAIKVTPRHGKDRIILQQDAVEYLTEQNPGRAWNMLSPRSNVTITMTPNTGLFNQSEINWFDVGGEGKFETLSWGYNIVRSDPTSTNEKFEGFVELDTVHVDNIPSNGSWRSMPWNHHVITCQNRKGNQMRYGQGWTLFTVMYARTPLYQRLEELEPFPFVPMTVTASRESRLRTWPSKQASANGSIAPRKSVTIVSYLPQGSEIWGVTTKGLYILLREVDSMGIIQHYTDWRIATQPVLNPVGVWELSAEAKRRAVYGWAK